MLVGFVVVHALLYKVVVKPSPAQFADYASEKQRESLINQRVRETWSDMMGPTEGPASDHAKGRALFDVLDTDHNGSLTLAEISALAHRWNLSQQFVRALISRHGQNGEISFDAFYHHLYSIHGVHERMDGTATPADPRPSRWRGTCSTS